MKDTKSKFPLKISELNQIELKTPNLADMIKFYGGILGCDIVQTSVEVLTVRLGAGRSLIDLRDVSTGPIGAQVGGRQSSYKIFLQVEDWDENAVLAHFNKHGVPARTASKAGHALISVNDPDGNIVQLSPTAT